MVNPGHVTQRSAALDRWLSAPLHGGMPMVRLRSFSGAMLIACCTLAAGACVTNDTSGDPATSQHQSAITAASTLVRDANGTAVATVVFTSIGTGTLVTAVARIDTPGVHGFHVHANDNPANGDGCIADPTQPANTFFVSADGHFNPGAATHGNHAGDMPPLFASASGSATASFITDRFVVADVKGRAVILHAG